MNPHDGSKPRSDKRTLGPKVLALGLTAVLVGFFAIPTIADHQPADKIAVSGSAVEVVTPYVDNTVLTSTLKTSSPTDLIIQVTLECAIFTDTSVTVTTEKGTGKGNKESAESTARVEVWVTVDGEVLPVSSDDTGPAPSDISLDDDVPPAAGPGKVVFCHRTQGLEADLDFESEEEINFTSELFIRTYQGTRSANAFNWVDLNLGSGEHVIEVHAQILDDEDTTTGGAADQKAVVGKRTLVVQPVKLANDATI